MKNSKKRRQRSSRSSDAFNPT